MAGRIKSTEEFKNAMMVAEEVLDAAEKNRTTAESIVDVLRANRRASIVDMLKSIFNVDNIEMDERFYSRRENPKYRFIFHDVNAAVLFNKDDNPTLYFSGVNDSHYGMGTQSPSSKGVDTAIKLGQLASTITSVGNSVYSTIHEMVQKDYEELKKANEAAMDARSKCYDARDAVERAARKYYARLAEDGFDMTSWGVKPFMSIGRGKYNRRALIKFKLVSNTYHQFQVRYVYKPHYSKDENFAIQATVSRKVFFDFIDEYVAKKERAQK